MCHLPDLRLLAEGAEQVEPGWRGELLLLDRRGDRRETLLHSAGEDAARIDRSLDDRIRWTVDDRTAPVGS